MSITHLSLVNQKLAYAGAVINILNKLPIDSRVGQKLERQALGDAVVFHLIAALSFYLREIAEHHRLQHFSAITSVQELSVALIQDGSVSFGASELLNLYQTNDSWLNQMLAYHARLSKSPEKTKEKKAFVQDNLIQLLEIDDDSSLQLTPELLISWLNNFRALIGRQRETSAEY